MESPWVGKPNRSGSEELDMTACVDLNEYLVHSLSEIDRLKNSTRGNTSKVAQFRGKTADLATLAVTVATLPPPTRKNPSPPARDRLNVWRRPAPPSSTAPTSTTSTTPINSSSSISHEEKRQLA
ncbi:hypothetical protein EYF80_024681 [Liparis tanakae]|uniref:Uncharacterized protein n=1 Tax=Liparis tanakae TaxID=230148 RepID=A0A4Z2HJN1_9TELE|nr:hypothetical protein EYF80_024681 [Liparis tanakae]